MGVEMAVMIMIGLVILIIMVSITIMAMIWGQEEQQVSMDLISVKLTLSRKQVEDAEDRQ